MKPNDEIRTVAVVGAGLIGSGWAAYFLAQGWT
jgi:3-hydroxyacyl-CoA dehydrogenase